MDNLKKILATQTIKDTGITFIGFGVTAVVGFIYTIIIARSFGPEHFGVFSAVVSLVAIIYSLGDFGIASSLVNFLPKFPKRRGIIIGTTFWFEFIIGFFLLALFGFSAIWHNTIVPGSLTEHFVLAGFLTFNYLLIGYAQGLFSADKKFVSFSLIQVLDALIKISIIYLILEKTELDISLAISANIISTTLALLFVFGLELSKVKLVFDKKISHLVFHFAKWIALSKVFSVFISRIDIILLNLLSTSFDAGIFAAANRVTLVFAILISSLGSVTNPRYSSFNSNKKIISYTKKILLLISAISLVMVSSAVFANPIILFVFGAKYIQAIPLFQGLVVAMVPFLFSFALTSAITYSFQDSKTVAITIVVQVVTILVIDLALIPIIGVWAPVLALGVSNLIALLIFTTRFFFHLNSKTVFAKD